ncbi:hypothetical protein E2C01_063987 [Portunus trituberculatus]|uniref:Uncharacterized protein n=1 Tax=Portunus trituberculatus TaxID=210409 RepID=A0A5B7HJN0_PORTR|nr:hypothetical protein [Portunus trituberculatus]
MSANTARDKYVEYFITGGRVAGQDGTPRSYSTWRKTLLDRSLALISPRPANEMQVLMKPQETVASYVGVHSNICNSSRSGIALHQGISRVALPTKRVATTSEGSN